MTYQEITKLSPQELETKLTEQQELLTKLKITHKINPIEKPMRIRHTRKFIARIKTAQNISQHAK